MPDELKKVRKGTKSCTECRRRKVRCTWSSDEAPKCRRCEERGTNCVAQIYSLRSPSTKKLNSRDRIARLEQQVSTLSKALHTGGQGQDQDASPVDTPDIIQDHQSESEDSDLLSVESEGFGEEHPSHLSNLFENDLISSDNSRRDDQHAQRTKEVSQLGITVRRKLQELIPPQQEVSIVADYASQWLSLFHALFPAPSMIKSGQEMTEQYEAVKDSSIDPAYLASWLLCIAMTIHQVPKEKLGPESQLKGFRNASQYSKAVSDVVEATIMRHDVLLGTIQGIDASMLFLRLQLSRGNFKKTWLLLRRVIAVAELIGLHRAARQVGSSAQAEEGRFWADGMEQTWARKAQVWESLCSVDRVAGLMFNLPPGTRRYRLPQYMHILDNGNISLRAYLCSLSEIAMKVQDLEDLEVGENADTELYSQVLKIDGELRVLASVVPAAWWHNPVHIPDQLLQYWHFYITVRVHLPFTLRHDTSEQFSFSRLACMKACQTLIHRFRIMRSMLPTGFFLCRICDLQVFTALIVLTLAYHAASPAERANLLAQGAQSPEQLIPDIIEFMRTLLKDPVSIFARRAVDAVTALTQLLDGGASDDTPKELKFKVPLLGKLHVRPKRPRVAQIPQQKPQQNPRYDLSHTAMTAPSMTTGPSSVGNNTPFSGSQDEFPWDPLSWSIEDDQAGVFQDAIMMEDFSPFGTWWDPNGVDRNLEMGF